MKKFILIVSIALVLALCLGGYFLFTRADAISGSSDNTEMLLINSIDELNGYIEENETALFDLGDDGYFIKQEMFGEDADVYFFMDGESVDNVMIDISLFDYPDTDPADEENSDEQDIYEFTDKDKAEITEKFESVKKEYEEYIGCSFTAYNKIPTRTMDEITDTDERFFAGDFVKEYTVRDTGGVLWIMRYEASYGTASVKINKIVNETLYEGYLPLIDLSGN